MYEKTNGLYDPSVYPLIDLWGFSPRFNSSSYTPVMPYDRLFVAGKLPLPDQEMIEALLPLVGLDGIELLRIGENWFLKKNT